MAQNSVIFGCEGHCLTAWEKGFFSETKPYGFVLFGRNCDTPEQIKRLIDELKTLSGQDDLPVLVDQEGGRVARLRPPHWRKTPAAAVFGKLYEVDADKARRAAYLNACLISSELTQLGFTVDCAPVLDLTIPGAHEIVGDRSYGATPEQVAELARSVSNGFLDCGIMPVIKHLPGHGRALVDSHKELPRVSTPKSELVRSDFEAFRLMKDSPWGMTAHVIYEDIDPDHIATVSPKIIGEIIRKEIGFEGILLSDDLSMKAMQGSYEEKARSCLAAGCDIVLHCNGDQGEMSGVAAGLAEIDDQKRLRLDRAWKLRRSPPCDSLHASAELNDLLSPYWV
ncbi:beta-N-acetylhexosaminidase [Kiloniella laminariae]|uniref:beta-N-acetylhexosaminidase n=1 Tax=Kiloniella laminariae TaxID=454162 RepID=A0ABT4LNF0_9PROT|nr:beta-N-acetylhexosaminidase [Kiloniella laminariae]MCZ4282634.1 beta-N-acetylhexosaminidase [Kiloniella laminariae]